MSLTLTNLIATPTFEGGSVGGWTASAGTMTVSTDKSAFGTQCLKVTSTAASQAITIYAPSIPYTAADIFFPSGMAIRLASSAASATVQIGQHYFDGAGVKTTGAQGVVSKSINTTLTRHVSGSLWGYENLKPVVATIKPVITWTASASGQSIYIDTVTFLRYGEYNYLTHPWGNTAADIPDVIGSLSAWGNVTFAWQGTPEASLSTATSSAVVTLPSVVTRGAVATITGSGFTPSAQVGLRVADDDQAMGRTSPPMATVTADGTGAFTYSWTATAPQGPRWIAAQTAAGYLGYGAVSSTVAVKAAPADPPSKNFIINPAMRTANGTARNLFNICPNPTPTMDLTGWDAVGAATVTRSTAAKIKGPSHGARVVSADAADGIALPWQTDWEFSGQTVYVRAVTACTLTIGALGDANAGTVAITYVGWGDNGWGETDTYVSGATITLAAGETTRARAVIRPGVETNPFNMRMKITGSGTFDVDGMWHGMGVSDGDIDAPGSVPFFCGGTPTDADFTYEWLGTPYASGSARRGRRALGIRSGEGDAPDGTNGTGAEEYDMGHLTTRPGGETAVALRSAQWFFDSSPMVTDAAGSLAVSDLGLETGKSYMLSADVIMDYSIVVAGYALDGSNGNETWLSAGDYESQPNLSIPGRARVHVPFNVDTGTEEMSVIGYWGWLLGEIQMTKLSLTETTIYGIIDPIALTDLTELVEPGATVMVTATSGGPVAAATVALEAQVGGVWAAVQSVVVPTEDWEMTHHFLATIPSDAAGVRLTCTDPTAFDGYFTITDPPVDYFDGSTPDADGWAFAWEGTPDASPSLRTAASSSITAQVFVGGTAKAVSEVRVSDGGSLIPVTELGT